MKLRNQSMYRIRAILVVLGCAVFAVGHAHTKKTEADYAAEVDYASVVGPRYHSDGTGTYKIGCPGEALKCLQAAGDICRKKGFTLFEAEPAGLKEILIHHNDQYPFFPIETRKWAAQISTRDINIEIFCNKLFLR